MVRARGLTALIGAAVLPFAFACGSSGGGGGGTASSCNPNSVSQAPAPQAYSMQSAILTAAQQAAPAVAAKQGSDPVLKIGFIGILSGQYQAFGVDEQRGVQLAIDAANQAGVSYNGTSYTLQLDSQDDAADATKGAQGATKLVDDGVVAVIGGTFSTATIAESKIFSDNGITQISPSATNPKYTSQGFKTAFRVVGRDDQQGPADADFIVKTLGCKKVGVMDDKSTYGQGLADNVNLQVPKDGGTVVDREHVDASQSDFSAQLTAMKGHSPDVIFYGGYSPQFGPLVQQARRQGIKAAFVSGDGSQDSEFIKLAGSDAENMYASNAGPAPALQPGYQQFNSTYKAKYNADIFQYAPQAYDAANIVINAIKKGGGDKAAILQNVAATSGYSGVAQTYSFNSTGDVKESIFTIYKVEGGQWKAVKAVTLNVS
ncbi:MAG TPA: branched-chain amino acid ABC transporter substrate-binding protein [Candidatus Dormibacteraeota bacterium]|nr:branched-chain amino acid ABC transporter substrate-binding protein [Candidatus Dormibacteraeota bacterium]